MTHTPLGLRNHKIRQDLTKHPAVQKQEYSADILKALEAAKEAGALKKWGAAPIPERVNVFQGELKRVGVRTPGAIATPTVRNERAFLVTVVGVTSVLALAAGQLPGDWVSPHYFWEPFVACICPEHDAYVINSAHVMTSGTLPLHGAEPLVGLR